MPLSCFSLSPPASSASQIMLNDFQYAGHTMFENSLDIFTIQKETVFGSKVFEDVKVRITSVINVSTGTKLSDDFRQLIFDPINTFIPTMGYLFFFDSNFWLCTFTDNLKSVLTNIVIRRCNEQLRWIDNNGIIQSEYCCVDYEMARTMNLISGEKIVLPQGHLSVYAQLNERTELITPNQRFLFGRPKNRICLRVFGNGIMNSQNQQTLDDSSSRFLTLDMDAYQVNPQTDDLINGVADAYKSIYSINLSAPSISGNVGETYNLGATLLCNNLPTSGSLTYSTTASNVALISASELISLSGSGTTTAFAYMGGNPSISTSALVTVTASGTTTNEIRITPSLNTSIIEGETQTFTSYLYTNGIQQTDVFTFSPADLNVPTNHYILSILSNNSFSVENLSMYLDYPLIIMATSGSYSKQIQIMLAGAF